MNNRDPSRPDTPQDQPAKPFLPFSIENILRKGAFRIRPEQEEESALPHPEEDPEARVKERPCEEEPSSPRKADNIFVRLPWLAYTRYCPPKIPRSKPRRGNRKHKLDRNPRIPFSTSQLAALEAKFLDTHYLSSVEVRELSSALSVTEHRVKIWFQNRRAREKKTKGTCDGCTIDVEN